MFYFSLAAGSLVLIPLVLGCWLYRKLDIGMRFLVFFLGFTVWAEILGYLAVFLKFESYWSSHIFTLCEFIFISIVLSKWQRNPRNQRICVFAMVCFCFVWLIAKLTFESPAQPDSYTAALGALALTFLAALTIFDLFSTDFTPDTFYRDHRFWICCTFLLCYAANSVNLSMMNIVVSDGRMNVIFPVNSINTIIRNVGFTAGLLCLVPRPHIAKLFSQGR